VLTLVLPDHPNRTLTYFWRVPAWTSHDPILSTNGASGKPGAVHIVGARTAPAPLCLIVCRTKRGRELGLPEGRERAKPSSRLPRSRAPLAARPPRCQSCPANLSSGRAPAPEGRRSGPTLLLAPQRVARERPAHPPRATTARAMRGQSPDPPQAGRSAAGLGDARRPDLPWRPR
jgi:hypothetical protein